MHNRCNNPNIPDYSHYGARGITVSTEWDDFWVFVENMGDRPDGHTLDRIDNDGNYCKENCKWSTPSQQLSNRRPFVYKNTKGYSKRPDGKYNAHIKVKGKKLHLGTFECPLMAHLAYQDATAKRLAGLPVT